MKLYGQNSTWLTVSSNSQTEHLILYFSLHHHLFWHPATWQVGVINVCKMLYNPAWKKKKEWEQLLGTTSETVTEYSLILLPVWIFHGQFTMLITHQMRIISYRMKQPEAVCISLHYCISLCYHLPTIWRKSYSQVRKVNKEIARALNPSHLVIFIGI